MSEQQNQQKMQINDDLYCIENIENMIEKIKQNYNPYCPFCQTVQIVNEEKKEELKQNSVAVFSQKLNKYYLCQKKCIQNAHSNTSSAKFICIQKHIICKLSSMITHPSSLELHYYNPTNTNESIGIIWEFYHPISSFLISKLEKIIPVLEHVKNNNQICFWNMINLNPSYYEPNLIIIPYSEFRSHLQLIDFKNSKKYDYNFVVSLDAKTNSENKDNNLPMEFLFNENNNELRILANVLDCNDELIQKANFKIEQIFSQESIHKVSNGIKSPPGFNKTQNNQQVLNCLLLRSLIINLPLYEDPEKIKEQNDQTYSKKNSIVENVNLDEQQQRSRLQSITNDQQVQEGEQLNMQPQRKVSRLNINAPNYQNKNQISNNIIPAVNKDQIQIQQNTIVQQQLRGRISSYNDNTVNTVMEEISAEDKILLDVLENQEVYDYSMIKDKISVLAKLNQGSRILQKILGKLNQSDIDQIIQEIQHEITSLMLDYYGNYMIQSLINVCTVEQRYNFLEKIADKIAQMAFDKKGTHSLQTVISLTSLEKEITLIVNAIQTEVFNLSMNNNGTHFIQKCIFCFDCQYLDSFYQILVKNFVELANNAQGLCVLKALMNKFKNQNQTYNKKIINLISENVEVLIQSPFGNYAIQHSYELYGFDKCSEITSKILKKLIQFSSQKFSSNVIEKLVSQFHQNFLQILIDELIKNDQIRDFMKNKYGSFILLKVFQLVETLVQYNHNQNILLEAIKKNLNYIHAANFKTKWQSFLDRSQQQYVFPLTNLTGIQKQFQQQN